MATNLCIVISFIDPHNAFYFVGKLDTSIPSYLKWLYPSIWQHGLTHSLISYSCNGFSLCFQATNLFYTYYIHFTLWIIAMYIVYLWKRRECSHWWVKVFAILLVKFEWQTNKPYLQYMHGHYRGTMLSFYSFWINWIFLQTHIKYSHWTIYN